LPTPRPIKITIPEVRNSVGKYGSSYRVAFEFQDEAHNTTKGSCDWFLFWPPEVGDTVTALYNPDDPKRCTLYPTRGYSIAGAITS